MKLKKKQANYTVTFYQDLKKRKNPLEYGTNHLPEIQDAYYSGLQPRKSKRGSTIKTYKRSRHQGNLISSDLKTSVHKDGNGRRITFNRYVYAPMESTQKKTMETVYTYLQKTLDNMLEENKSNPNGELECTDWR